MKYTYILTRNEAYTDGINSRLSTKEKRFSEFKDRSLEIFQINIENLK